MRVTELLREGLKREYEFAFEESEIYEKVEGKLLEAQPGINLRGFRTGRVPMKILRSRYGDAVRQEIVQETVKETVSLHLDETGNRPATPPETKFVPEGEFPKTGLVFKVSYECLPDIPEVELGDLKIDKLVSKPNQEFLDKNLNAIADSHPELIECEGGHIIESDNVVALDYRLSENVNNVPTTGEDIIIEVGSGNFQDGEDSKFIGAKVGDIVNVHGTFQMRGGAEPVKVGIECTVKSVSRKSQLEIGEPLAAKVGFDSFESLLETVTRQAEIEINQMSELVLKKNLIDAIMPQLTFDVPEKLGELETTFVKGKLDTEEADSDGDAAKSHAKRRLRIGLYFSDLAKRNEFGVAEADIERYLRSQSNSQQQYESLVKYAQTSQTFGKKVYSAILEEKAVAFITELVAIEEKEVECQELVEAFESINL